MFNKKNVIKIYGKMYNKVTKIIQIDKKERKIKMLTNVIIR